MSFLKLHKVLMDLEVEVVPFYMTVFHVKVGRDRTWIHDLPFGPWLQSQPNISKCKLIANDVELPRSIRVDHHIVEKI